VLNTKTLSFHIAMAACLCAGAGLPKFTGATLEPTNMTWKMNCHCSKLVASRCWESWGRGQRSCRMTMRLKCAGGSTVRLGGHLHGGVEGLSMLGVALTA
jgi:hypothetical protein